MIRLVYPVLARYESAKKAHEKYEVCIRNEKWISYTIYQLFDLSVLHKIRFSVLYSAILVRKST